MSEFFKPLKNLCMFLNAVHVYTDEASKGQIRVVDSNHYCAHVRKDLRQCLIYDSPDADARLIGVEYMIPYEKYIQLPPEEQKLWHSHDYEVHSGMLVVPSMSEKEEYEAMKEITTLYGKTWHFWQVDRGDDIPMGYPVLMGSLTQDGQVDLDETLAERNRKLNVDHHQKADQRRDIPNHEIHPNADPWHKN
ncbi:hypothetical protein TRICI_005206 [Trichomonascus ciferrii]|uniref:DUF1264 domain-containing protein n=1 Tax=Trichomonascus ciferrii TaxID=44093 RepID=A0A642UUM8_9ASCO|nr:hypothetical protein TRICI_005206 [Trichomonascus ciferrii]